MSFASDIKHLMTSDTSLNLMSEGGIQFEIFSDNSDLTKDWIVYSFNKTSQISCLNSTTAIMRYNITVKIISASTIRLEEINDYVISYLNGKSYNKIQDIIFASDNHIVDLEKGVYANILQFDSLYS